MKALYIFATSDRPDAYINAIAYSVEHLNVGSIYLIVISEHDYPEEEQEAQVMATGVLANILLQLQALKDGKYMTFSKAHGQNVASELENKEGIQFYSKYLEIINKSGTTGVVVPHSTLGTVLKNYIDNGNCLFDVSALKKNLLVDVVTILLSYNFSEVYSFELQKKPSFGQKDLYHNLKRDNSFAFRNLANSEPVQNSLRRISRWTLRARAIFMYTAIVALIFIPISIFWKDSSAVIVFNSAAIIAGIGSYLYMFVRK